MPATTMTSADAARLRLLVITDAFSRACDARSRASLQQLLRLEMEGLRAYLTRPSARGRE